MIPPAESLLKQSNPVLVSKSAERKSLKGRPLRVSPQQPVDSSPVPPPPKPKSISTETTRQENKDILTAIFPPREWMEGNQLWVQQVSSTPCTRTDVVHLEELLDRKLEQRRARLTGICPVRRELYSQCFDELIRQVTINGAERGLLLLRISDLENETQDLKKQLNEQKAKCDETEKREKEKRLLEEKRHTEEIQFLKRTNQQLKTQLEKIITPKQN
ncbi:axonemal dynein light intermediate polypeptide 1-like isoform X2 [Scophthalmus maximus]|uniref:axonemal dynein light intermediate polypeptide 1-like isoform X2 n=1 Tax=Scophthalmus maximus TaxID=52904 RepID=UPI001FA84831|nr:axonemal dynein light intermediate polypeptide 1-like isoform X2 [Scophthalmus maximus]